MSVLLCDKIKIVTILIEHTQKMLKTKHDSRILKEKDKLIILIIFLAAACVDSEKVDCAFLNTVANICHDVQHAKTICPKFCNLCDLGKNCDILVFLNMPLIFIELYQRDRKIFQCCFVRMFNRFCFIIISKYSSIWVISLFFFLLTNLFFS
jgi:hypothetical protein